MYRLDSGRIQLTTDRDAVVEYLRAGDFFGEKCFLGDHGRQQAAKAVSQVSVTAFSKPRLLDLLKRDRRFARGLLRSMACRMDRYEQTIGDFVTEPAERRLARLLRRLTPAHPSTGWVQLPFPLTNPELAKTIGTTRWRVSHLLSRFRRLGWLRRRRDTLSIHREGLDEFLASPATKHETAA